MRIAAWIVIIFLLQVLQAALFRPLHIIFLNLSLLLVVAAVLFSEFNWGLTLAVIAGILSDWLSATPDGMLSFTFIGAYLIMYFAFNQLLSRHQSRLVTVGAVVVGSVLFAIIFLVMNPIFSIFNLEWPLSWSVFFSHDLPVSIFWNLIFAWPLFALYLRIDKLKLNHVQSIRD